VGVGEGARGPLTRRLQEAFFSVVNGEKTDTRRWLTPVNAK
jgi:branched-chain amino acid aminotransferase